MPSTSSRTRRSAVALLVLLGAVAGAPDLAAGAPGHAPGQVLVRYVSGTPAAERAAVRSAVGATLGRRLALPDAELLVVDPQTTVRESIGRLAGRSAVRYAEPNHYATAQSCPVAPKGGLCLPNDPRLTQQWTMHNTGQSVDGKSGSRRDADVDAAEAWSIARGSAEVVVAVVDSGIAYDNPDLAGRIWHNAGEEGRDDAGADRRSNGVDDDGNGYVDDWQGWDVVGRSVLDPSDGDNDPRDVSGHGTHVAGIIGAAGGNGLGVAGLNWDVRLMNVRVRAERSNETSADIADAFAYAARNGARVVNVSLAETEESQYLADTIEAFPGTLFVIAAGNKAWDLDRPGHLSYPCEYPSANVVCVAATGRKDELAPFSSYSPGSVDLAAPGMITLSSMPAYRTVLADAFEADPFGAPARWLRGSDEGGSTWAQSTERRYSGDFGLASNPAGAAVAPGSASWVQNARPFDLAGQMGCEVETQTWLEAGSGAGLYLQARGDDAFLAPSRTTAADSSAPSGDTVAFFSGSGDRRRLTVNVSDLDGDDSVWLRYGVLASGDPAAVAPRAWIDDLRIECLGGPYSPAATTELAYMAGTSMATPHVAGAAALMLSQRPGLDTAGLKDDLLRAVDPLPELAGKVATGGRLNVYKALARTDVAVADGELVVAAGEGTGNRVVITRVVEAGVPVIRVRDPWAPYGTSPMTGSRLVPGDGCARVSDVEVACPADAIDRVVVRAGDMDDTVTAAGVPVPVLLDGGPGADRLTGGAAADVFAGGPGNDTILARDRVADASFDCGEEPTGARDTDAVTADRVDPVTASAANCEKVAKG